MTFEVGSSIDGFWKNGALQRVKEETTSNVKALKQSVTFFVRRQETKLIHCFQKLLQDINFLMEALNDGKVHFAT